MKQLIIIIVLLFSTLFNGSLTSAATAEYDHNELLNYKGYGETMYESIVEQSTFITGKYTDNKEYVHQSINQIKDYTNFWFNEQKKINDACGGLSLFSANCAGELVESGAGYMLTVGDFVKKLFGDYDVKINPSSADFSHLAKYFTGFKNRNYQGVTTELIIHDDYKIQAIYPSGSKVMMSKEFGTHITDFWTEYAFVVGGVVLQPYRPATAEEIKALRESFKQNDTSVKGILKNMSRTGIAFNVFDLQNNLIDSSSANPVSDIKLRDFKEYINNNNLPRMTVPQPTAYLSCPDGTRIKMAINGGTFLDVNGQVMQVSKDGTATVDSQLCNLGWEKPTVQYVDGTDQVGISTPDGKILDAETGETISGGTDEEIEFDDTLEGCDGVLCGIGKLLSGLASIAKSIAGLVGKILDGLLALFVPDDLNFVSEEFEKMSAKLTDKFSLLTGMKDTITGVFQSSDSGNALSDVNMSLPAAPGFNFSLDTVTFIEPFVPRIKQIISGIVFLMTIIYVYRKITGRGGVMEK